MDVPRVKIKKMNGGWVARCECQRWSFTGPWPVAILISDRHVLFQHRDPFTRSETKVIAAQANLEIAVNNLLQAIIEQGDHRDT